MNLIIDIGNTFSKYYIFKDNKIIFKDKYKGLEIDQLKVIKKEYKEINNVILSSVKILTKEYKDFLNQNFNKIIFFDEKTTLPIENLYETQQSLGKDRLAAAVGANFQFPNQNILIIDAGTAITYDFVDAENKFLGGNISVGLNTRFASLHHFTDKLPLLQKDQSRNLFGRNTNQAIISGVQNGLVYEVDATIDAFKEIYTKLIVIITGGDADFFDRRLKNHFFVRPNILALGLNTIFNYNDKKQ